MTHPQVAVDALDTMFAENDGFIIVGPEYRRETIGIHNIIAPLLTADLRKELDAANAKLAMAREALTRTADQALGDEIPPGYGPDMSDGAEFHRGYDAAIQAARAALAEIERMK